MDAGPAPDAPRGSRFFLTVDAETEVIEDGIRAVSRLRDEAEARHQVAIPITWFVRFQRAWGTYVENDDPAAFEDPPEDVYDGFDLARQTLRELRDRGDEIAWHYHAYNYVHRDDLSHAVRLRILENDLRACAAALRRKHPDLPIESFRFGWFFVPDYALFDTLASIGITRDASVHPGLAGRSVAGTPVRFLEPLATAPTRIAGLSVFPFVHTLLLHDWSLVAHDLGWTRKTRAEAWLARRRFALDLFRRVRRLGPDERFSTYATFPVSLLRTHGHA
jgi:hypothetical protein